MKRKDVNQYISNFFSTRKWYQDFFEDVRREYRNKQKPIQDTRIVLVNDFVEDIEGNLGYYRGYESLVPQVFATDTILGQSALCFSDYITNKFTEILELYQKEPSLPYFMADLQRISYELSGFMRKVAEMTITDDTIPMPYLQLRQELYQHNLSGFKEKFNSLLASLSYNIKHDITTESYFHICTHLILKMIGFDIISEDETDGGRIDSVIDLFSMIYIFEYKYSKDDKNRSKEALQQILDKSYAEKYRIKSKLLYGVGFSFGKTSKKIDSFKEKQL